MNATYEAPAHIDLFHEGPFTMASGLVLGARLVNVSVLRQGGQPTNPVDYLRLQDTLKEIERLSGKHLSMSLDRTTLARDLAEYHIAYPVTGTPGRPTIIQYGRNITKGPIDYAPGFWMRAELVSGYAEWLTRSLPYNNPRPLVKFVKSSLADIGVTEVRRPQIQRSEPILVAQRFAEKVSPEVLIDLQRLDAEWLKAGYSNAQRIAKLNAVAAEKVGGQ